MNNFISHRFGAERGICAFSGAPRSAIINGVLCQQLSRPPTISRQSVLLSQNGSYPQIPLYIPYKKPVEMNNFISHRFGAERGI